MKTYLITVGIIHVLSFGYNLAKHGQPKKEDTYNAWHYLIGIIGAWLFMYWCGLFNHL